MRHFAEVGNQFVVAGVVVVIAEGFNRHNNCLFARNGGHCSDLLVCKLAVSELHAVEPEENHRGAVEQIDG